MIKETGGDRFETTRSLLQDLSFKQAEKSFQAENIKFGIEQKRTLALIGMDGSYTNLGLLLSDQYTHTIKAAVFEGTNKKIFKDRSELSGSILKQLEDSYLYLDQFNPIRSEISGLKRIDMRNYPSEAIREALLNAVVHRDYSYSGSTHYTHRLLSDKRHEHGCNSSLHDGQTGNENNQSRSAQERTGNAALFVYLASVLLLGL